MILDPDDDGAVLVMNPSPWVEYAVLCGQKLIYEFDGFDAPQTFRRVCIRVVDETDPVCPTHGPRRMT